MIRKAQTHTLPDVPGPNGEVVYALLDSADGFFSIDEQTGVIGLERPLDRELQATYELRALASDQGSPRLSSVCQVAISVLDINDNPPVFQHREYTATAAEDVTPGVQLLRVQAASRDAEANGEISYSIIGGNEHGLFSVDPRTGTCTPNETCLQRMRCLRFGVRHLRRHLCHRAAGLRGLSRTLHHHRGHGRRLAAAERHGHRQHQPDRRQRQPAHLQPGRVHGGGRRGRRAGEGGHNGEARAAGGIRVPSFIPLHATSTQTSFTAHTYHISAPVESQHLEAQLN